MLDAATGQIRKNHEMLSKLDSAVGDGDHGTTILRAMEAVSKELPAPICDEFRRVVQEMQLGLPMDKSLDNLIRRIPSEDLDFVVTAINVQREVGGLDGRAASAAPQAGQWLAMRGARAKQAGQATVASWAWQ